MSIAPGKPARFTWLFRDSPQFLGKTILQASKKNQGIVDKATG